MDTSLNIIVAVDKDGGFGKNGKIPWYYKEDFKHFKKITNNSVCIMGRKTYQEILEKRLKREKINDIKLLPQDYKLLPNRECIVISKKLNQKNIVGAKVANNLRSAIEYSNKKFSNKKIFIIGGYRLFVEALPFVHKIYMTIIHEKSFDCDVFFPLKALKNFEIINGEKVKDKDELLFVEYVRRKATS